MAKVPYTGYPTASPNAPATPNVNVSTPGAAFGSTIASAVEGLGGQMEKSGGELFQRAIALQDLRNETEAREADAQYTIDSGKLYADYDTKQGSDRVAAFPKYIQDVQDLRTNSRAGLSNDMARKLFDASSLSTMSRAVFYGARTAAGAGKDAYISSVKAQSDLDINQIERDPTNEVQYNQIKAKAVANATQLAQAEKGASDPNSPIVKDYQAKAISAVRRSQLVGLSREQPMEALAQFNKHSDELSDSDKQAVQGILEPRGSAAAAINISNGVYNNHLKADGSFDTSVKEMQDEIRTKAEEFQKDNPFIKESIVETAVSKLDSRLYRDRISAQADKREAVSTLNDTIVKNNITDVQQLLAIPGIEGTIKKYGNVTTAELQKRIDGLYRMGHQQTNQANFIRLKGISNSDVNAFLDTDLTQEPLNKPDYETLNNRRNMLLQNPVSNPHVERAMLQLRGAIGSQLQALKIYSRKGNEDEYDKFMGTLSEAIEGFQEANHRPPNQQELVDKIAPALLQTIPGAHWWSSDKQKYDVLQEQEVPDDVKEQITTEELSKGNMAPTDDQIKRRLLREQFIKFFGGKGPSKSKPAPNVGNL